MTNDKFLKLTNTVYKVLEFFPESDPLKNRAKDRALAIMEHLVLINENSGWASFEKEKAKTQILEDIDVLLGYLWIGKSQGWLNSSNCLIIANEYEKITLQLRSGQEKAALSSHKVGETGEPRPKGREIELIGEIKIIPDPNSLSDRQSQILEFLSQNEKAQVMDLRAILPDVTKRTIRRDLDELLEAGKIVRLGEFNQIFYKAKG